MGKDKAPSPCSLPPPSTNEISDEPALVNKLMNRGFHDSLVSRKALAKLYEAL